MTLDRLAVRRLAELAGLELPGPERLLDDAALDRLTGELSSILDHVHDLDALTLPEAPAPRDPATTLSHGLSIESPLQADVAEPPLDQARALEGASRRDGTSFVVPRVIGG